MLAASTTRATKNRKTIPNVVGKVWIALNGKTVFSKLGNVESNTLEHGERVFAVEG